MDIGEEVIEIVINQLSVKRDEVVPEARFIEDLGADSLDTVGLIMAIEDKFDFNIPDEEVEKITTVREAIEYITAHTLAVN